jgi:DNA invertase Pin-like site-specific DNA recombinase
LLNPNAGKHMAELNKRRVGIPLSVEHRAKVSASLMGRKMPKEAIEKTAQAQRLKWTDPTHRERMRPSQVRGGLASAGENNGLARLKIADVRNIREAHRLGESTASVARRFSVGESTVRHIWQGRTWKSVPVEGPESR